MVKVDNPARRLKALVAAARALPPNIPIIDGWRNVLGVPEASISELLVRLGPVLELPSEVRSAVGELLAPEHAEIFLQWVGPVEAAFSILRFDAGWDQFQSPLKDARMMSLDFCEIEMDRRPGRRTRFDPDQLSALSEQVLSLARDVADADDLSPDLRAFITERLAEIYRTLQEVKFRGAAGVEAAVATTLGLLAMRQQLEAEIRRSNTGDRAWRFIQGLALAFSIGADGLQITDGVQRLLDAPTAVDAPLIDINNLDGPARA